MTSPPLPAQPNSRFRRIVLQYGDRIPTLLSKHLINADQIWEAWRDGHPMPPLETHKGPKWYHAAADPLFHTLFEIFVAESYTGAGFYQPFPGDTVIDCGANIGLFALFLSIHAPGIRIHCFEPAPDTLARFRENLEINHLATVVKTYAYALARETTTRVLRQHPSSGQRSFIGSGLYLRERPETVDCLGLSGAMDLCGSTIVDLLKLDIEGAEVEVLEGVALSTWKRIRRIVLEYHDDLRPGSKARVISLLNDAGFQYIRTITTFPHSESTGIIQAAPEAPCEKHRVRASLR